MNKTLKKTTLLVTGTAVLFLAAFTGVAARTPQSFLPASLSYSWPGGGLADQVAAKPALGFSLGYLYGTSKHFHISARATWMRMALGTVDTVDFSNFGLTHVGILGGVRYRFIKHGWTPYVEAEAGMGIMFADVKISNVPQKIDDLSEVKFSYAGAVGVQIPLSETIDIDVAGRYHFTFVSRDFSAVAAHVGIVYALW